MIVPMWWWLSLGACTDDPRTAGPPTRPSPAGPPPPATVEVAEGPHGRIALARRFAITTEDAGPFTLACTSPLEPEERHVARGLGAGELPLFGLLGSTPYTCVLRDAWDRELWSGGFETDPVPADLPGFRVSGDPDRAALDTGYTLFSHWQIGTGIRNYRLVVADGQGRIRWWLDLPEAVQGGVAATWTGTSLVLGGGGVPPSVRDLDGEVRFEVGPPAHPDPDDDVYHHEAVLTPLGLLSLQSVPDGDGRATWKGFRLEVTDPVDGEVRWSFDSRPARAAGELPPGGPDEPDPYHANAVTWRDDDPDGPSVWVSLKRLQQILRIDRTTGALSYIGHQGDRTLVDPEGRELPDTEWFWGQHAPEIVGRDLLVYDNGPYREPPRYSRVVAYHLDDPGQATLRWSWTEPGWYEPNFGSVQTLPGGTVLVATGHASHVAGTGGEADHGWLAELDPAAGEVVWRLDFDAWYHTTYRAQFVDGCALFVNERYCPATAP
jgi:hypothetical protein